MKSFFINEAFDKALNDYFISKDKQEGVLYNSFLVVVIRMLIQIYGELDIINPFRVKNEDAFDSNLRKYNAKKEDIDNLKRLMDGFYKIELRNIHSVRREVNPYFIEIQKVLIDLFNLKRLNFGLTRDDSREFFDLLYTPGTSNVLRLSYNYLNSENIYEIAEYYKEAMKKEITKEKEDKKNLLNFDVYKLFNVSIADLSKMDDEDVDKLNREIYESFDISENAINKDYLLNEKIRELKIQNEPITTGNGYVDILLIMSIIITVVMVVVIFSTLVF